jgi:hypothetical protein
LRSRRSFKRSVKICAQVTGTMFGLLSSDWSLREQKYVDRRVDVPVIDEHSQRKMGEWSIDTRIS